MKSLKKPTVDIGPGASSRFVDYIGRLDRRSIRIVADSNTWAAAGERVASAAKAAGIEVAVTIYGEEQLVADARSVLKLLIEEEDGKRLFVAVGSGTITDIVRFVAQRTGRDFVSVPTAPSVDAYGSVVAPLVVDRVKRTVGASAPAAIFADTDILSRAPRPMIAAGFGDMLCKFSAVADWRLGALLWGESYDEEIARRALAAASSCVEAVESIGRARPEGLAVLMAALVESGLCMADAGNSRPASGAEHQYSHFWEMRLLREGRPPVLHGLKVGVGTLVAAGLWERLRSLSREDAARALASCPPRSPEEERGIIRAVFGGEAAEIEAGQERFLSMTAEARRELGARILGDWERIRDIARGVPDAAETARLLAAARCPADPRELGLGDEEIDLALRHAHYLRDRFTARKLSLMLFGDAAPSARP